MHSIIDDFRCRKIKAKDAFEITPIHKSDAYDFVMQYHYLGSAKFFSTYNFGMFIRGTTLMVGVATYSNPQGPNSLRGWFDIPNSDQTIMELSRLCVLPELNGSNASSFLLGNTIRMLKAHSIRAVITLADSGRHVGSIYQVCNFRYYGLTPERSLFYTATNKKNPRIVGKKDICGVWVPMNRKHRYAYILDPSIKVLHKEEPYPPKCEPSTQCIGCNGNGVVYDTRFGDYYTCPECNGAAVPLTVAEVESINMARGASRKDTIDKIINNKTNQVRSIELW